MKIKIVDARRREAPTSGYGLMSYQFAARLANLGNEVHFFDEKPNEEADIWLWIRPPHYIKEKYFDETKPNVFFTMHEQETFEGWKADWPQLLNKCKAVITPTEWNKGVFQKNGVTVTTYVCPLGVDEKIYCGYKNKKFSILSVFDGLGMDTARDDWKRMITAYYKTFYNNFCHSVQYDIKSWRVDWQGYEEFERKLVADNQYNRERLPKINIYEIDLVPEDFNQFYSKHHAFLKCSKGEGWGLPTLEALSCGLRIISAPTPAMLTFLNEKNTDFFTTDEEMGAKLWENWRRYKKLKDSRDQWSWKEATIKLNKTLNDIQIQG